MVTLVVDHRQRAPGFVRQQGGERCCEGGASDFPDLPARALLLSALRDVINVLQVKSFLASPENRWMVLSNPARAVR
jgi:hypothetical protein